MCFFVILSVLCHNFLLSDMRAFSYATEAFEFDFRSTAIADIF